MAIRLVALLVSALLLVTAHSVAAQPQGRVLADMVIRTFPAVDNGHCITLDAGALTVALQLVGNGSDRPVSYRFFGYRGTDPAASIEFRPLTRETQTFTTPLLGGLYCYSLRNETPTSPNAPLAEMTNLTQDVRLRMVLADGQ